MAINKNGSTPQFLNLAAVPIMGVTVVVPVGASSTTRTGAMNIAPGVYNVQTTGTAVGILKVNGATVNPGNYNLTTRGTSISVDPIPNYESRTISLGTAINGFAYNGSTSNKWVAFSNSGVIGYSTNGVSWTTTVPNSSFRWNAAVGTDITQRWVIGGNEAAGPSTPALMTSTDAITWTTRTLASPTPVRALAFETSITNKFVAVGQSGTIATSTDAITWTTRTSNTTTLLNCVINSPSLTEKFFVGGASAVLRSSTDGITWTTRTPTGAGEIFMIAHASSPTNKLVIAGDGGVLSSTDGATWTTRTPGVSGGVPRQVVWTGTKYVVTFTNGFAANSTDAVTWVVRTTGTTANFIQASNGMATDGSGTIFASTGVNNLALVDTQNGDGATQSEYLATLEGPLVEVTLT